MKKLLAVLLCVAMVVTVFCSCGKDESKDNTTTTQPKVDENAVKEVPAEMVAEPMKAATSFAGGTGTEEDPYLISDAAQLVLMAETIKERGEKLYFKLTKDIVFNDTTDFANWENDAPQYLWTPVDRFYRGGFDGDGYTISGLYGYEIGGYSGKEGDSEYDLGFFNTVGADAYVKNLKISNSYFNGLNMVAVGCIAGHFYGTLTNCQVLDSVVKSRKESAGALVGVTGDATVENCETNDGVVVSGGVCSGAVFGHAMGGTYKNCVARGTVNSGEYVGGFAGMASGKFENITNYASLKDTDELEFGQVGGCFGNLSAGSDGRDEGEERITTVKNCVNYSENIKGSYAVGGIAGNVTADNTDRQVNLINCQNKANLTSNGLVGGLVGETLTRLTATVTYSGCTNDGVISSNNERAAGIGAKTVLQEGTLVVENCVNNGEISSLVDVAGILADISYLTLEEKTSNHFTISACTNNGNITGSGDFAGGIVGMIGMITTKVDMVKLTMTDGDTGLIENCKNTGKITVSAGDAKTAFAGGIAGLWNTPITKCEVKNCSNSGEISSVNDGSVNDNPEIVYESGVGGIIGLSHDNVKVQDCKNSGTFTAIEGCLKGDLVASKGDFYQSKED